jgi:Iron-containing redox enzyme
MTSIRRDSAGPSAPQRSHLSRLQQHADRLIQDLITSLPGPETLAAAECRGIIARYAAVLEGNFIYWMTAAHLAVVSDTAREIVEDNLREEVRDNHPGMLRRFAVAAHAFPTDADAMAITGALERVRLFVGSLSGMGLLLMMAFFEGFITRFMPYLADLARRQGSAEYDYTDVHGTVDVVHTEGLFRALEAEMTAVPASLATTTGLLDGVEALRALILRIVLPTADEAVHVVPGITAKAAA